jgi:hypothetical protein
MSLDEGIVEAHSRTLRRRAWRLQSVRVSRDPAPAPPWESRQRATWSSLMSRLRKRNGSNAIADIDNDQLYLMPEVGGAEITQLVPAANNTGIKSETLGDSFWYAATSGVPSN